MGIIGYMKGSFKTDLEMTVKNFKAAPILREPPFLGSPHFKGAPIRRTIIYNKSWSTYFMENNGHIKG